MEFFVFSLLTSGLCTNKSPLSKNCFLNDTSFITSSEVRLAGELPWFTCACSTLGQGPNNSLPVCIPDLSVRGKSRTLLHSHFPAAVLQY